jgi:GNAT superfamily N-acetyltransferase
VDVTVRTLALDDAAELAAAAEVLAPAFGAGAFSASRIGELAADPARLVLGAWTGSRLVCLGMAERVVPSLRFFEPYGADALALLARHRIGHLSSMATASDVRARGIGQRVARELCAWLSEHGCDLAVAASWVSGGPNPSAPGLEKLGFRPIARSSGEAHRMHNLGGRPCPICGVPCACSGILFVRALD